MPTLLDTHAWLWWVTEDRRLSQRARAAIRSAQSADEVLLSLISIWEIAKKVEKPQLVLDRPVNEWFDEATTIPGLHLVELTRPILIEGCALPQPFVGDAADQIIVATSRHHAAAIVTKDRKIRRYAHVRCLW